MVLDGTRVCCLVRDDERRSSDERYCTMVRGPVSRDGERKWAVLLAGVRCPDDGCLRLWDDGLGPMSNIGLSIRVQHRELVHLRVFEWAFLSRVAAARPG